MFRTNDVHATVISGFEGYDSNLRGGLPAWLHVTEIRFACSALAGIGRDGLGGAAKNSPFLDDTTP